MSKEGDQEAFARLFSHFSPQIFRYVRYRVGHDQEAEDVTAAVFLKVWEHIPRYQSSKASFRVWLYRIAHNTVIDHYRKKKPVAEYTEYIVKDTSELPAPLTTKELSLLKRAITTLTPAQQQIVFLRFYENFNTSEIAAVVGKEEGAVRVAQHRALKKLQEILKEAYE